MNVEVGQLVPDPVPVRFSPGQGEQRAEHFLSLPALLKPTGGVSGAHRVVHLCGFVLGESLTGAEQPVPLCPFRVDLPAPGDRGVPSASSRRYSVTARFASATRWNLSTTTTTAPGSASRAARA